jgi:hypothetical protein
MVVALLQTSLELMLLVCFFFQAFVAILCAADLPITTTTTIQSILPILEDPLFSATLLITVSFLLWTGNHGVRQMIIRF